MLKENFDKLQPLGSTSSSYSSSSSCSSASSTSSKYNMEQKSCRCNENIQNNLILVMNDLKQICTNLSLITRQIDQVVNKIESKFGNDEAGKEKTSESLKCLKDFTKIINNNIANIKDLDTSKTPRQLNRNTSNKNENIINNYINDSRLSERKSNEHFSKIKLWNPINKNDTFQRSKCTRSKSQPAFKETQVMPPSSTNTNLNKFSIFEPNQRMTSSPISNPQIIENNGDSSFYEDQLDNELESIENNPNETITVMKASSSLIKNDAPNGIQKTKPKSSNSNYHVSFNINNAIYTSKQETPIPIPISILKHANNQNKIIQNDQVINSSSSSSSCSPLQSSLKKSPGINFNSTDPPENKKNSNQSKSVRIDTKTTIL